MSEPDTASLLARLTLDEKLALLAGESQWRTAAIDRLGIPSLKVSDGPSGARGEVFGEGIPAAFLPCGVSLGATWDPDLLYEVAQLLGDECKTKSASVLLAPTICIPRHPLGGRNFEAFSEDPYVTGKLAVGYVRGIQSRGIGATPKHFVANDQETKRFKYNVNVASRALREVYLLPFQMIARDADPWCMMSAYNKVNGHYCDASRELLIDIARGEWGWRGVFMSDWGGTTSTVASINNGLDLEMPGPPTKRSKEALEKPIQEGLVDLSRVTESADRILGLLKRAGRFADPRDDPEVCDDTPEKRDLLLRAATAGIVMLKNDSEALPLRPTENLRKLGIFGPNAQRVVAGGGGSSYIKAPYWTSVQDSVMNEFRDSPVEIVTAEGAKVNRYLPVCEVAKNPDTDRPGAAVDWYNSIDCKGDIAAITHVDDLYFMSFGTVPPEVQDATNFSFRLRAKIQPRTTGSHAVSLASIGPAKLSLDGNQFLEQSGDYEEKGSLFFTYGSEEKVVSLDFVVGKDYELQVDYQSHGRQHDPKLSQMLDPMEDQFQGIRVGFREADQLDRPAEAAGLAADCDAAIVVVGRDKEWETEGQDILSFDLPGEEVRLIRSVAAVCKRTIVLVQAGTPVNMEPWIQDVDAVLYIWYQGQELGNAAAAVLCGRANPSGRLPITFPRRIEDCPAFSSFPAEQNEIHYTEGLFVGYRWWDLLATKPLFPLGFGLSYNTFEVVPGSISTHIVTESGSNLTLTVHVTNTGGGDVAGRETVIAWFSQAGSSRLRRPKKQICAFAKSRPLLPGETQEVELKVDHQAFGMFDPSRKLWVIDANTELEIMLGTTASNAVPAWRVMVDREIVWTR
ncbi:periplasmic beta-glucosidase precursor [Aspergillus sclerotioniger CBS 115572]|uniref:beta-glucosidase n=1 Tax=Aspergillus sclerotioniger CBS 115572 TaxID=1450535 RepID=A0A317VUG0_9EURO|nr:periplasmic beta-glucosidase precursor [Aspergillus sclerotioniger CBS 115572]PWY78024.1 periplasmic beta-glucosidase precursor [Aspergillus sclerotioniger CBS 115572]